MIKNNQNNSISPLIFNSNNNNNINYLNIDNNFISTCDNKKDIITSFDNFNNNIKFIII